MVNISKDYIGGGPKKDFLRDFFPKLTVGGDQ